MKPVVDLSPLGTARLKAEDPLLAWLSTVQERLASSFGIEPEVSYLAWEVAAGRPIWSSRSGRRSSCSS